MHITSFCASKLTVFNHPEKVLADNKVKESLRLYNLEYHLCSSPLRRRMMCGDPTTASRMPSRNTSTFKGLFKPQDYNTLRRVSFVNLSETLPYLEATNFQL